ncbi:ras-related protein Rab-13-like isoform X1 [Dysidea avara]|uniref:ras-related protein Rab-13-like isoform X1 n=1 Tax=Dysidea avara TaxID=196820 RepID=UPI00331CAF5E
MAQSLDYLLKFVLVGAECVGKSSLLSRYAEKTFSKLYVPTIGIDFSTRSDVVNGERLKIQIWDSSGQERFKQVVWPYFRTAAGIVLVYDITDEASFIKISQLMGEIKEECHDAVFMVVGNKCDLESSRVISKEKGESFADEHGCKYMETSASDNVNVNEMIMEVAETVLSRKQATD